MSYETRLSTAIRIGHVYAGNGPAEALTYRLMEALLSDKAFKSAWKREERKEVVLQRVINDVHEALKTNNTDYVLRRAESSLRYYCVTIDNAWYINKNNSNLLVSLIWFYAVEAELKAAKQ